MNNALFHTVICVPCYNESKRLNEAAFLSFVNEHSDIAFLFVNDGSKDNTLDVLNEFAKKHENLQVLNLEQNGGKAEAVRQGMLYAYHTFQPQYIGFWDADLATPLDELPNFITIIQQQNFDIVTGLRLMRLGAKVKRKNSRHFLGRIFATFASKVLRLPVYDTQCGAKLYKAEQVPYLFEEKFITRWLFDVEILARYLQRNNRDTAKMNIYEFPLFAWEDKHGSQVKTKDFVKAPMELWKIRRRYFSNRKAVEKK
jgi:glycosyltransferase involved in cell wall biosynthesis